MAPCGTATEIGGKTIERNLLTAIIRPRIEEILELLQNRMAKARMEHTAGSRFVLTGGASQLTGLADLFARQSKKSIGIGKPIGVTGLDDNNSGPGYAACIGGLIHLSLLEDNDPDDPSPGRARWWKSGADPAPEGAVGLVLGQHAGRPLGHHARRLQARQRGICTRRRIQGDCSSRLGAIDAWTSPGGPS